MRISPTSATMSKLDWMYKSSSTVDPEDYLLGKAIDKNFETQGSSRNEVDKDILPTSIFANANSSASVDVIRKIKEDPLEQIKQKEIEMRKQLLKNPVKLRKLQSMLKAKAERKDLQDHKKKKKKKKNKEVDDRLAQLLQKYGTKKFIELAKSDESDEGDSRRLKERSRKNKRDQTRSDSSSSSDSSPDMNEKGRNNSRGRSSRYEEKKNKKVRRRRRRDDSGSGSDRRKCDKSTRVRSCVSTGRSRCSRVSSESSGDGRSPSKERKRKSGKDKSDDVQGLMNDYMKLIEKHGAKKLMELISDDSDDNRKKKSKKNKRSKSSSESDSDINRETKGRTKKKKKKKVGSSCSSGGSEDEKRRERDCPKKVNRDAPSKVVSRKQGKRSSSSSSYSPDDYGNPRALAKSKSQEGGYSSDEGKSFLKKGYGLVLPKGVENKPKSSLQPAAVSSSKKVDDQKSKFVLPKPSKLTEEEKDAKLKEMMANAQWRDQERKTKVAKYREEAQKEADSQNYDEGFMRKELAKAVESSRSVEERIKSRMNSVQRSKFSMSQNFSRRT